MMMTERSYGHQHFDAYMTDHRHYYDYYYYYLLGLFSSSPSSPTAFVKLLKEVDAGWLKEQKVDFFLCDQLWVQGLPLSKDPIEQRYCSIIHAGVEAGVELCSMDWAVQVFINRRVISPITSPRYTVSWPHHRGDMKYLTNTTQVFYCKYGTDRYEVGDVVKVSTRSSSPEMGGRGGSGGSSGSSLQYGRIIAIHLDSKWGKASTIELQEFEQSNPSDTYELTETTRRVKVEVVRLRGKVVLVEQGHYSKYYKYTYADPSVFYRKKVRS